MLMLFIHGPLVSSCPVRVHLFIWIKSNLSRYFRCLLHHLLWASAKFEYNNLDVKFLRELNLEMIENSPLIDGKFLDRLDAVKETSFLNKKSLFSTCTVLLYLQTDLKSFWQNAARRGRGTMPPLLVAWKNRQLLFPCSSSMQGGPASKKEQKKNSNNDLPKYF